MLLHQLVMCFVRRYFGYIYGMKYAYWYLQTAVFMHLPIVHSVFVLIEAVYFLSVCIL